MQGATPGSNLIVRSYALDRESYHNVLTRYANLRCGGNRSLALRSILTHFDHIPGAYDLAPVIEDEPLTQEQPA